MWKSTLNPPILVVRCNLGFPEPVHTKTLSSGLVYLHFPHEFNNNSIFLPSSAALLYFTDVSVYVG